MIAKQGTAHYSLGPLMKLAIKRIESKGNFAKEMVALEVTEAGDVGKYMLSDSTYTTSGQLSNKIRHIYWFPDKEVEKGDYIWLYTRPARADDETKWRNKDGTTTHVVFWRLHTAVWNDEGDFAVLLELNTWKSRKVSD
jgi:hypothetical protein